MSVVDAEAYANAIASFVAAVGDEIKAVRERDVALARLAVVRDVLLDAEHEPRCADAINEDCDCILAALADVLDDDGSTGAGTNPVPPMIPGSGASGYLSDPSTPSATHDSPAPTSQET